MAMTRDGILQRVQEVLVDALGVDNDEVTTDATLMGDLRAESIDFLDIVFRLEKTFGIKFNRVELFPAERLKSNPKFVNNGKLTATGLTELKSKMPHIQIAQFEEDPDINKLGDLLTIETIVNYVDIKINNGQ
ncbi:MAG: acyl carrier protein [Candidatus Kariarchaeaceae archaeon]